MSANTVSGDSRPVTSGRRSPLNHIWAFLVLFGAAVAGSRRGVGGRPGGYVWLIDDEVAVQIYGCSNL